MIINHIRVEVRCPCGAVLADGRGAGALAAGGVALWNPEPVRTGRALFWRCGRCGDPRSIVPTPIDFARWLDGERDPRRVGCYQIAAR